MGLIFNSLFINFVYEIMCAGIELFTIFQCLRGKLKMLKVLFYSLHLFMDSFIKANLPANSKGFCFKDKSNNRCL